MRHAVVNVLVLSVTCALVGSAAAPTFAASTSPGKASVFASSTGVPLAPGFSPLLAATIVKGKKKTVLAVTAMYTDGPYAPTPVVKRVLGLSVSVNGVLMQPSGSPQGAVIDCGFANPPPSACAVSGTWWLDIDAAETANPGVFYGQPLVITLTGGDLSGGVLIGVQSMDASLSAVVQKK
jgi:hypothetical protein